MLLAIMLRIASDWLTATVKWLIWRALLWCTGITPILMGLGSVLDALPQELLLLGTVIIFVRSQLSNVETYLYGSSPTLKPEDRDTQTRTSATFFWKLMFWKKREENYGARKVYTTIRATGAKAKALCREHSMTQHLEHGNLARPSRLRYGDDWARMDPPPSDLTKRSCSLRDSLRGSMWMTSNSFDLMPFEDQMAAMQKLAVELYKLHNLTGIAHMRISHKRSVRVIEMNPREVPKVQLADYSSAATLDSNMHAHIDRNDLSPLMNPASIKNLTSCGKRDDMFRYFVAAASLLTPTDMDRVLMREFNSLCKDDKKRKEFDLGARKALRLPFFGLGHETPQYAAYLHAIEKGDLDFTKIITKEKVDAFFKDHDITIPEEYLRFLHAGLTPSNYHDGGCMSSMTWPEIMAKVNSFMVAARATQASSASSKNDAAAATAADTSGSLAGAAGATSAAQLKPKHARSASSGDITAAAKTGNKHLGSDNSLIPAHHGGANTPAAATASKAAQNGLIKAMKEAHLKADADSLANYWSATRVKWALSGI